MIVIYVFYYDFFKVFLILIHANNSIYTQLINQYQERDKFATNIIGNKEHSVISLLFFFLLISPFIFLN